MYVIKSIAYKKSLTVPKKNSHKQACRTRFVRLRLWSPCKVFDQVTYTSDFKDMDNPFICVQNNVYF